MTRPAGTLPEALADPRIRLGAGIAALLATAGAVRRDRVEPWEARAFLAVNGLPDALYPPAWVVMQAGAFGAVPAAAATAWRAGDGELAGRLLLGGTGAWALSKVVKQAVRRFTWAPISRSTSRAEWRWGSPLTRQQAWPWPGRGALLAGRLAPAGEIRTAIGDSPDAGRAARPHS